MPSFCLYYSIVIAIEFPIIPGERMNDLRDIIIIRLNATAVELLLQENINLIISLEFLLNWSILLHHLLRFILLLLPLHHHFLHLFAYFPGTAALSIILLILDLFLCVAEFISASVSASITLLVFVFGNL